MTAILPSGDKIHPDPLKDDLSLIVDSPAGLVLVLGCAHAGMINIIEYALEQTDGIAFTQLSEGPTLVFQVTNNLQKPWR
jgi:7,8-dihydropterin-6-yl-methyl-4-(beta-D-ribofuranosyl)aminobenzene 5'-phosphate synthase